MHRCGPEIFPQKIYSVKVRTSVCKDIFTRIFVSASYDMEAKKKKKRTNKPNNLDTNKIPLSRE